MTEKIKKKKPASRRKTVGGEIPVKYKKSGEAAHVIDLKRPTVVEPTSEVYNPAIITPPSGTRPNRRSLRAYRRIALSFVILVIVSLGIVAYFALVKLNITVTPKINPVNASASFTIYDRPENYDLPVGSILGLVRQSEVEYSQVFSSTGSEALGAEVSGLVTILNNYSKDQPLVATTRLLTPTGQLLRLKETVLVPAGGSVSVEVYGDTVDPSFTLADTKLTIPGLWAGLQDQIYAVAKANSVSYKEQKKLFVTQTDLDNAITQAKESLIKKADKDIADAYVDYDQRLYKLDDASVGFSFDAKVGDEKDSVEITMTAKVDVVAFKTTSITQLDDSALAAMLSSGQSLVASSADAPSFSITSVDTLKNVAEVTLTAIGQVATTSTNDLIDRAKLVGLTETQIRSYLDSLEMIESYQLQFRPAFFKVAPQLVDRIIIHIK